MSKSKSSVSYRVGVDIGGTFTDVVVATSDRRAVVEKLLSTPQDYAQGVIAGATAGLTRLGVDLAAQSEIVHATTVATNAIIERAGSRCALVTTEGFRDVLEIGRLRIPVLYDMGYDKPPPLVSRDLIFEVRERIDHRGNVVVPLDRADAAALAELVAEADVQSVAICLLNAYANDAHEALLAEALRARMPAIDLSISSIVLPQIGEYERTSTTVINAYVMPTVRRYLRSLTNGLRERGVGGSVLIMRSGGGVMSTHRAEAEPVHMVESGPAAGVLAARNLLAEGGFDNLLTFDVGGTTAKASIIEKGELLSTVDYEVGGVVSATTRLTGGGGYPIQIPVIDIAEVGAGGGSIVWVDAGGSLRVGPQSAGAVPGPVCYDQGGEQVTLTDANLVLGYINPEQLAGDLPIRPDLAERALRDQIAGPLGLELVDAAHGIHVIAVAQMMGAIRSVSTQRGRDVRDYALVAFGGNGPLHAVGLARGMGISTVVVPPAPGVFSATGLLVTDIEHEATRTLYRTLAELGAEALDRTTDRLRLQVLEVFAEEGADAAAVRLEMSFRMRYAGQNSDLLVTVPYTRITDAEFADLAERFGSEHASTFGHRSDEEPVMVVQARVVGRISPALSGGGAGLLEDLAGPTREEDGVRRRAAYFGREAGGYRDCPILGRDDLSADGRAGPLLLEEYDSVTVVPPDCTIRLDRQRNIVVEVYAGGRVGS